MTEEEKYQKFLEVHKSLEDADVPTEQRYMRVSKSAFLELGGTEEAWDKLEKEQL